MNGPGKLPGDGKPSGSMSFEAGVSTKGVATRG